VTLRLHAILVAGSTGLLGCKADLPELTDASGGLDARCTGPYADLLVDTFPVDLQNASAVLGAPDTTTVTLATDSLVTVGFVALGGVTDANGVDLKVHAMVDAGSLAVVRVAQSDMVFRYAGDVSPATTEIDIQVADYSSVIYARVVGVTGTVRVDAIEATHDMCP
jgi:hypothetical protein